MKGFPQTLDKPVSNPAQAIETGIGDMSFGRPPAIVEKFYRLANVAGTIANFAVEEVSIQSGKIVDRKIVSDRDNKPGAMSKLLMILERGR